MIGFWVAGQQLMHKDMLLATVSHHESFRIRPTGPTGRSGPLPDAPAVTAHDLVVGIIYEGNPACRLVAMQRYCFHVSLLIPGWPRPGADYECSSTPARGVFVQVFYPIVALHGGTREIRTPGIPVCQVPGPVPRSPASAVAPGLAPARAEPCRRGRGQHQIISGPCPCHVVPARVARVVLGVSAVHLSTVRHVHPAGWCSHRREDLNLWHTVLETAALAWLSYSDMKLSPSN